MSTTGEERWRTARGQQHPPPQSQNRQRQNSSRTNSGPLQNKQGAGDQGIAAAKEKAGPHGDRGNAEGAAPGPPQEQHVPVRSFNASDVQELLKRAYESAMLEGGKSLKYKAPGGQVNNPKSGSPWASKPNAMGNGKDFFLELRKQVSALQQGGERAGG